MGFENIRIHPSTRYQIRCGIPFFHSGERIYFIAGLAVEFAGCLWTVAVYGKKKLRIRKYPDTCGRGLSFRRFLFYLSNQGISFISVANA